MFGLRQLCIYFKETSKLWSAQNSIEWFSSYLNNCVQYTAVLSSSGQVLSNSRAVYSGLPQGSVIGPLLFNIHTSDIIQVIQNMIYRFIITLI